MTVAAGLFFTFRFFPSKCSIFGCPNPFRLATHHPICRKQFPQHRIWSNISKSPPALFGPFCHGDSSASLVMLRSQCSKKSVTSEIGEKSSGHFNRVLAVSVEPRSMGWNKTWISPQKSPAFAGKSLFLLVIHYQPRLQVGILFFRLQEKHGRTIPYHHWLIGKTSHFPWSNHHGPFQVIWVPCKGHHGHWNLPSLQSFSCWLISSTKKESSLISWNTCKNNVHLYTYIYDNIYIFIYMHVYTHWYTHIHVYIYTYMYKVVPCP